MAQLSTALMSLLPVAGAVALTVQGLRRRAARSRSAPAHMQAPIAPPRAKEPPPPPPRAGRAPQPDGACSACGTAIPARTTQCTACERAAAGADTSAWTTLAHWLVFLAVMTAIIGAGWLVAP
jgi:hypothetical protein